MTTLTLGQEIFFPVFVFFLRFGSKYFPFPLCLHTICQNFCYVLHSVKKIKSDIEF